MKLIVSLLALFALSTIALAQETPKVELFGGYSIVHESENDGGELTLPGFNAHGWNGSVTYNLNKYMGIKADFSGHYKGEIFRFPIGGGEEIKVGAKSLTYLFGPQFSYRNDKRITPFGHVLIGGAKGTITFNNDSAPEVSSTSSDSFFAMAFGGGIDVKMKERIAIRIIQADFIHARSNGEGNTSPRFSFGVVFKVGK